MFESLTNVDIFPSGIVALFGMVWQLPAMPPFSQVGSPTGREQAACTSHAFDGNQLVLHVSQGIHTSYPYDTQPYHGWPSAQSAAMSRSPLEMSRKAVITTSMRVLDLAPCLGFAAVQ